MIKIQVKTKIVETLSFFYYPRLNGGEFLEDGYSSFHKNEGIGRGERERKRERERERERERDKLWNMEREDSMLHMDEWEFKRFRGERERESN